MDSGSKPSNPSGVTLERGGNPQHFAREVHHYLAVLVDRVRHRVVGQRGGKQHGAVGLLAPQVAPDVVGGADLTPVAERLSGATPAAASVRRSARQ